MDNKIRYDRSIYYVYFTSAYNTLYTYSILKINIFKTIKKIKSDFILWIPIIYYINYEYPMFYRKISFYL